MLGADLRAPGRIASSTGWSADSKPSTSRAWEPSPAIVRRASPGVEQAAVGRVQPRLRERAHALGADGERLEAHARRAPVGGPRLHAHPGLGDHAERALRAGEHPVGARPGAGARQPPRLPLARGRDRADRLDEVLDVRPHGREMARRARGDPAAERGELKGLREVAQGEAVLGELRLERGAGRARLDARRARDRVDLEHAVERAQVDRDRAVVRRPDVRRDAADDRRAAAERDRGDALGGAPLEHALQIDAPRAGARRSRGMLEAAAKAAHDVGVGLAERVATRARARRPRRSVAARTARPRAAGQLDAPPARPARSTSPSNATPMRVASAPARGAHVAERGLLVLETPAPVLAPANRPLASESKRLKRCTSLRGHVPAQPKPAAAEEQPEVLARGPWSWSR